MTSRPRTRVFRPGPVWGCDRLVSRAKVIENQRRDVSPCLLCKDLISSSHDTLKTIIEFPLHLLLPHPGFVDVQRLLSEPVRLSLSVDLTTPILTGRVGQSLGSSSERLLDSSSPSPGPSRRRCRSPTAYGLEIYTHPEDSGRGAFDGGYADAEAVLEVGISKGLDVDEEFGQSLVRQASRVIIGESNGYLVIVCRSSRGGYTPDLGILFYDNSSLMLEEEFRQVRKDRDDTRRRLRRLESYVERHLGPVWGCDNCPEKYQVKELIKLMTEVYCLRNEIQKIESELWNLTVKNNDLAAYTQRFQELTMMCTKMVPEEEDRVEKFIGGLPDNIQGNVITAGPIRLQDAVR
ncbi:reverse transcriptase domain-containing protein, partial [Tanacetum coccineum]